MRLVLFTLVGALLFPDLVADNVLKDKLVVYDNANKQIGWKNFDCTF